MMEDLHIPSGAGFGLDSNPVHHECERVDTKSRVSVLLFKERVQHSNDSFKSLEELRFQYVKSIQHSLPLFRLVAAPF